MFITCIYLIQNLSIIFILVYKRDVLCFLNEADLSTSKDTQIVYTPNFTATNKAWEHFKRPPNTFMTIY